MLFSNWYFSMIFIVLATATYQWFWLRINGYKYNKNIRFTSRLATWILVFLPIVNTIIGLASACLLCTYVFKEDLIIKAIESDINFIKIK